MPDGMVLAESNAILFFLAQGSQLWPESAWDQAKALQWMFFEQYSHEPNVATVRFWISIKKLSQDAPEAGLLKQKIERGYDALAVMEAHLQDNDFFVADRYTVADIALYAYTHMAEEGGFSLKPFPAIQAWLMRIAGQLKTFPEGARKAPLKPETLDHHRDGHGDSHRDHPQDLRLDGLRETRGSVLGLPSLVSEPPRSCRPC